MFKTSLTQVFVLATSLSVIGEPPTWPTPKHTLVALGGSQCQTPSGICPLLDGQGNPIQQPPGSLCYCGADPGTVIQ